VKSDLKLSLARAQRKNESVAVLISFGDQQRIDRVAAGGHSQSLGSAVLNPLHPNKEDPVRNRMKAERCLTARVSRFPVDGASGST
jgi:hypothetical protein